MRKENQSLIDFLGTAPMASFTVQRSPISNKEAQTLYDIWKESNKDEYGKHIIGAEIDPMQITSLTTKGYVRNTPDRFGSPIRVLEFTNKGKDVIKKIILHQEKSAFEKKSHSINYEAICSSTIMSKLKSTGKVASLNVRESNWLIRLKCQ